MIAEQLYVKKYLGARFGIGEKVPDGIYAIPIDAAKGIAFIRLELKNGKGVGDSNFSLFWDEALTVSYYDNDQPSKPEINSTYSQLFRQLMSTQP